MKKIKLIGIVVIVIIIVVVAALLLMPPKERPSSRPADVGPSYGLPPDDQPPTPSTGDGETEPEEPGTVEDLAIDLSDLGFENPGDESSPVGDTSVL